MARPVIAPRRGEPWFSVGGYPTVRLSEYIEASAESITEINNGVVNNINVTEVSEQIADIQFIEHWRD